MMSMIGTDYFDSPMEFQSKIEIDLQYCKNDPDDALVQKACDDYLNYICDIIHKNGFWVELTEKFNDDTWFAVIEIGSALCNILFFLFVYYTPALQAHPMKLIMYISLAEFGYQTILII